MGLISFRAGDGAPVTTVPLTNFNYSLFTNALDRLETGNGTPLGPALAYAYRELEGRGTGLESVIMFSDGAANVGEDPLSVYGRINKTNVVTGRVPLTLHFVTFDTDASILAGYKNLGAATYEARDGAELGRALTTASERILLEDEIPVK